MNRVLVFGALAMTFLVSASDTLASVRKLRRLAWRADATVVAGHDLEQWTALRRGPEFYA